MKFPLIFLADACFAVLPVLSASYFRHYISGVHATFWAELEGEKERKRVGGWMVVQFLFLARFTYLEKENNLCGKGCVKSIHAYIDS